MSSTFSPTDALSGIVTKKGRFGTDPYIIFSQTWDVEDTDPYIIFSQTRDVANAVPDKMPSPNGRGLG
jgi:hypothetical protein